jgi:2-polyprenyl-3-methyl-5-hydroxy-6-metoxy-1,4-benzoquinol methylase
MDNHSGFKEKQYEALQSLSRQEKLEIGSMTNYTWKFDPKRLTFVLSRYKFVSKLLADYESVLEVGCGDGFAARIVAQNVKNLTLSDFDPIFVKEAKKVIKDVKNIVDVLENDFVSGPISHEFHAAYLLDVIEHINDFDEENFMQNICKSLKTNGVLIIGTPSIESQEYASLESKMGHVNCKSGESLKHLASKFFEHVFIFSMNDEVVHTGFLRMANYVFALCIGKKKV